MKILRIIGLCVFAYATLLFYYYIIQNNILYPEFPRSDSQAKALNGMEWINVQTSDDLELKALYKKAENEKPTILMFHGNGANIGYVQSVFSIFLKDGYGLLLAEYRCYNGNAGQCGESNFYNDARAYHEWLKDQNINSQDIVLYGRSLGSAMAVQLATEDEFKAVILEVPFSSTLDVAKYQLPFLLFIDFIMTDKYRSDLKIKNVTEPILFGLGGQDKIVTAKLGKKLFDLANEPKTLKVFERANHQTVLNSGFKKDVDEFLISLNEQIKERE